MKKTLYKVLDKIQKEGPVPLMILREGSRLIRHVRIPDKE